MTIDPLNWARPQAKRQSAELGMGPRVASIDRFIEGELSRLATRIPPEPKNPAHLTLLDRSFHDTLQEWDETLAAAAPRGHAGD